MRRSAPTVDAELGKREHIGTDSGSPHTSELRGLQSQTHSLKQALHKIRCTTACIYSVLPVPQSIEKNRFRFRPIVSFSHQALFFSFSTHANVLLLSDLQCSYGP
jgi:hypothetical protein